MAEAEETPNQPKIERVLPLLLQLEKDSNNDYLPAVVSFGPYHHGNKELAFMEAYKPTAVELFVSSGRRNKEFYYGKVVNIIDELRSCYGQASVAKYEYTYLAEMMLRDAALLIMYMEIVAADSNEKPVELMKEKFNSLVRYLGMLAFEVLPRDLALLENQIPLRVIRVLVDARDGVGRGDKLVARYVISIYFEEHVKEAFDQYELISKSPHLLDVIRQLHISGHGEPKVQEAAKTAPPTNCCTFRCRCSSLLGIETRCMDLENGLCLGKLLRCKSVGAANKRSLKERFVTVYRAATDLKAKGINFEPSSTQSLTDVTFKFHFLYPSLCIPAFTVETDTKVLFKNMIAYELSPIIPVRLEIVAFVNLIKSLVEKAEDVKELREKKILINKLGSDQEVLDMLKDINTHGADNASIYEKVRDEIRAHCDSKMRTWIAELFHTHFRTPWTVFAFFATAVLLGVSIAQLYYAICPN